MSKDERGILTKEMERKIADYITSLSNKGNFWKGPLLRLAISTIDNNYGEKIPEPWKSKIREIVTSVFEDKDYNHAITTGMNFINEMVDVPLLDDEAEDLFFKGMSQVIIAIVAKLNTPKELE